MRVQPEEKNIQLRPSRHAFFGDRLYFMTNDSSPPRSLGKQYSLLAPWRPAAAAYVTRLLWHSTSCPPRPSDIGNLSTRATRERCGDLVLSLRPSNIREKEKKHIRKSRACKVVFQTPVVSLWQSNGGRAHYIIECKVQWKPF